MTKRKVWRYYCEHCKKAGGNAGHMATHETHCTKNLNRKCRMCARYFGEIKHDYKALAKELDDGWRTTFDPQTYGEIGGAADDNTENMNAVMAKVNKCPACFLTIIRFSKCGLFYEFDFKKAKEEWWEDDETI